MIATAAFAAGGLLDATALRTHPVSAIVFMLAVAAVVADAWTVLLPSRPKKLLR
jgi:hypothetical protein